MSLATIPRESTELSLRSRVTVLGVALVAANALAWVWALAVLRDHPLLLGTALLAWLLGLRHAIDPDHIAAIDNVTRKLLAQGQQPVSTGLWFALGHSSVVLAACMMIGLLASGASGALASFKPVGAVIGTLVSTLFLLVIGLLNLQIFLAVWRKAHDIRRGAAVSDEDFDTLASKQGLLARLLRPLFALISKPWHMYPLGLLFGLGFDTATSIGLFSMAAVTASDGVSLWVVLVFPVLFTAGMALADAADGAMMLGAYQWARSNPMRKIYYNLSVTGLSVFIALAIGMVQGLGILAERFQFSGTFWTLLNELREKFDVLGFVVVGIFALLWAGSAVYFRLTVTRGANVQAGE